MKQQSGFRKNHSCETSINLIAALLLDLKRAFETKYEWFKDYLDRHFQSTGSVEFYLS
jgi:hypothetical protein